MSADFDETRLRAVEEIISTRRSIKPPDLDPQRPVSGELLERLLTCACWAPTHGLTEPWRFFVFQGAARTELGQFLFELYPEVTPAAAQRPEKRAKFLGQMELAPVVIALGVHIGSTIPATEEEQAVACAVQNFWLAASAAGLGVSWSSPPVTTCPEFIQWLGLDPGDRCLGLLYLGWPRAGLVSSLARRRPLPERCVFRA